MEKITVKTENQASDLEKKALRLFENNLLKQVKENLIEDGGLEAVVFIGLKSGTELGMAVMPVGEFMRCKDSKDALAELMVQIGKKEPVFISMCTEAWMSVMEADRMTRKDALKQYRTTPPSKDPNRVEVLICAFETENIQKQVIFEMVRDGGKISLKDFPVPEGTEYEGRFVGMLKDMKKIKYN